MDVDTKGMSTRGFANVELILPKISAQVAERTEQHNPRIDLSTAENCLLRPELLSIYKAALNETLEPRYLSYPKGFAGEPQLLCSLATFFNNYFHARIPVDPSHIVTATGASTCLDSLLFNLCDAGDGVLVPGPYWNGFDFQFRVRSSVEPILVNVDTFADTLTSGLVPALLQALKSAKTRVRALVLTNPHNPFGQCYPPEVLKQCLQFCQANDLQYISDEVYGLSSFESSGDTAAASPPTPFVSVLSLDLRVIGCDLARVHTVWSLSKDFGSSGIRMGCIVTQNNHPLVVGTALAANTLISSFSTVATIRLLASPDLPSLVKLNATRLSEAYRTITQLLTRHGIQYIPVTAGVFVFVRVSPSAKTWEDEADTIARIRDAGVMVSPGRAYHGIEQEKGWARITFAMDKAELEKAVDILDDFFAQEKDHTHKPV